jgi:hypothetical protein
LVNSCERDQNRIIRPITPFGDWIREPLHSTIPPEGFLTCKSRVFEANVQSKLHCLTRHPRAVRALLEIGGFQNWKSLIFRHKTARRYTNTYRDCRENEFANLEIFERPAPEAKQVENFRVSALSCAN